jgi:flagellar hook assembly protein FlgD
VVVELFYKLNGRLVNMLISGAQSTGEHSVLWEGADDPEQKVAAGVYFYWLEFTDTNGRQVLTKKMSLVKGPSHMVPISKMGTM